MPPFVIFALPRSRTAWLSRFLTYGEWACGHEELRHVRSLEDVWSWFDQPCMGTVETAAAPFWRLLLARRPDVRVVVVRRPVAEVVESLMRLGLWPDEAELAKAMRRLDAKLAQIEARVPGVLSVPFADLATEDGCRRVWEHCLPYPFDRAWWEAVAAVNVQISMPMLVRYVRAYGPQLAKAAATAKYRCIADMTRPEGEFDGVTIQQETFETWYRDGQRLFADHLVRVGEAPNAASAKNIPLLRALERLGALQITTARCNGRMAGYLMTLLSPSLESPEIRCGTNTTFYADPAFRGVGMKLQRASLAALRARGVNEVWWTAGPRGDGPRLGTIYRRLGAEAAGETYRLQLKGF